jgi:hypothetical protein
MVIVIVIAIVIAIVTAMPQAVARGIHCQTRVAAAGFTISDR